MKRHERGASMNKGVIGVYAVRHEDGTYYGSSFCVRGRISGHKSDLRLGKHTNKHLQEAFYKSGFEGLTFELLEECEKDVLTATETAYIQADDSAFNILKVADFTQGTLSEKISTSLKRLYKESPKALEAARRGLAIGRSCDAMKQNKHTPEANAKRSDTVAADWAEMSPAAKKARCSSISKGMRKEIPANCQHCGTDYTATSVRQKYCDPECRMGAFNARHA